MAPCYILKAMFPNSRNQNEGYGYAVSNAQEEEKAFADYTTLKNTQDGEAHFLKLHFNI